jgi:hypothetical protein
MICYLLLSFVARGAPPEAPTIRDTGGCPILEVWLECMIAQSALTDGNHKKTN